MPQPDADPDPATAFADFAKDLPVETAAQRRQRREAGTRRVAKAIRAQLWCAPCVALGATIAIAWVRPQPLLATALLALAALVGAAIGAVMVPLMTLLSFLRANEGGSLAIFNSAIPTERIDAVPFFHWWGSPGAVVGGWLAALLAAKQLLNAQVGEATPLIGGISGVAFYLVFRLAKRLFSRFHEPATRDRFDSPTP